MDDVSLQVKLSHFIVEPHMATSAGGESRVYWSAGLVAFSTCKGMRWRCEKTVRGGCLTPDYAFRAIDDYVEANPELAKLDVLDFSNQPVRA